MIWEWIKGFKGCCFAIRHFFRALVCKDYYKESHGLPMCANGGGAPCEWWCCPKRRDSET